LVGVLLVVVCVEAVWILTCVGGKNPPGVLSLGVIPYRNPPTECRNVEPELGLDGFEVLSLRVIPRDPLVPAPVASDVAVPPEAIAPPALPM
jgi:hypothetical protein